MSDAPDASAPPTQASLGAMLGLGPRIQLGPGDIVGERFEIIEHLGSGGFGVVFRARQVNIDREVALKVLRPRAGATANSTSMQRFEREMATTARLEHPNIVTLYDVGVTPSGERFMAMRLLAGRTLRAELGAGALDWPRAVHIAAQLCAALEAAHTAGIVHRDMKPANIMLTDLAGRPDAVTVLDFGLAGYAETDDHEAKLTATGTVLGTPTYTAPEQARGVPADARFDLYALGVILFEMLVGKAPFSAPSPVALMYMHAHEQPPALGAEGVVAPTVPAPLAKLVARLLSKRPEDRPQSAADVAQVLESLDRESSGTTTGGAHDSPVSTSKPRRRKAILIPATLAAIVLVGAMWWALGTGQQPPEAATLSPGSAEAAGARHGDFKREQAVPVAAERPTPSPQPRPTTGVGPQAVKPSTPSAEPLATFKWLSVLGLTIAPRLEGKEPVGTAPVLNPTYRLYCHLAVNARRRTQVVLAWWRGDTLLQRHSHDIGRGPRYRTWSKFKAKIPGDYRCEAQVQGATVARTAVKVAR